MEVRNQKGRAEWRLSGTITIKKMIKNQFLRERRIYVLENLNVRGAAKANIARSGFRRIFGPGGITVSIAV